MCVYSLVLIDVTCDICTYHKRHVLYSSAVYCCNDDGLRIAGTPCPRGVFCEGGVVSASFHPVQELALQNFEATFMSG